MAETTCIITNNDDDEKKDNGNNDKDSTEDDDEEREEGWSCVICVAPYGCLFVCRVCLSVCLCVWSGMSVWVCRSRV